MILVLTSGNIDQRLTAKNRCFFKKQIYKIVQFSMNTDNAIDLHFYSWRLRTGIKDSQNCLRGVPQTRVIHCTKYYFDKTLSNRFF
jgi:hypothetical protein